MALNLATLHDAKGRVSSALYGLETLVQESMSIPGWVISPAAREIALRSYGLPDNPVIVEVGAFMGRSTALLAGARRRRGSGKVHAIDPFDCSGDEFSIPHYEKLLADSGATTLEGAFRNHMKRLGVESWVEVYKGTSFDIGATWNQPIDLLLLDGDQRPDVARKSYELWIPFLKKGGQLIMHNVGEREYAEGHDGSYRLANEEILPPKFHDKWIIQYSLFASKGG